MNVLSHRRRWLSVMAAALAMCLLWATVVEGQTSSSTYVARRGDTHASIADRHGISVSLLHSLNPHISFYSGPVAGTAYLVPTVALTGPKPAYCPQLHTVNPGETLAWIAGAYFVDAQQLASMNNLRPTSPVYAGNVLCLPSHARLGGPAVKPMLPKPAPLPAPAAPAPLPRAAVPAAPKAGPWTGYYYNYQQSSAPVLTRQDTSIDFNWGQSSPGPGVGTDRFSIVWQGYHSFSGGSYTFIALTDDGVRLWVGGTLVIDGWRDQASTLYFNDYAPPRGTHLVQVEYYEAGIDANVAVNWTQN